MEHKIVQIVYGEQRSSLSLNRLVRGQIYVIRGYPPLADFIEKMKKNLQLDRVLQTSNDALLLDTDDFLVESRNNGKLSSIFIEFLDAYNLNLPLSQLELGNPRIIVPENIVSDFSRERMILGKTRESVITDFRGIPHRDLNRPHYSNQCNFWWTFHPSAARECLALFPRVFDQHILPYLGDGVHLDTNRDAKKISKITKNFSCKDFRLGPALQVALSPGDFILFNSEHFHCAPRGEQPTRVSCDLRYVERSFDENQHYNENSFYYSNNFKIRSGGSCFDKFLSFDRLSSSEQEKWFQLFSEDLVLKTLEEQSLKFSLDFLLQLKIIARSKSFYFLEKLESSHYFHRLRPLIKLKISYLSKRFMENDFSFKYNPVDYFVPGHHPFTQTVPNCQKFKTARNLLEHAHQASPKPKPSYVSDIAQLD